MLSDATSIDASIPLESIDFTLSLADIYDKVKLRLAGDPEVKGGALEVVVENGVVTIKGIVRTDKAKAKAEKVTGRIKGVTKVVNELKVSPTGN